MDAMQTELTDQVRQLANRLNRIEKVLGLPAYAPVEPAPRSQAAPAPAPVAPLTPANESPVFIPRAGAPGAPTGAPGIPTGAPASVATRRQWTPAAPPRAVAAAPEDDHAFKIEKVIGARLFAGIGALAIVIGAGLFMKFAYDRGWIGNVPPVGKCAIAAAFGCALLLAGGWARWKINAVASVGFLGAGLGVLYATVYGAYAQWGLVSDLGGITLLIGVSALGVGIGSATGLVSIAALALAGGYLGPVVFAGAKLAPWFLPPYLLSLFAVGLAISWARGRTDPRFHLLRIISWLGTGGLGTLWLLFVGVEDHPRLALCFVGAVWLMTHVERVLAIRGLLAPAQDDDVEQARPRGVMAAITPGAPLDEGRAIIGSFSATVWATAFGAWALEAGLQLDSWFAPAALLVPTCALGFILAGHLRALRDVPRSERERFGAAMLVQAGALVLTIIALALTGWAQVIVWLLLGVAAVVAGRWIVSRALDIYGLVALTFATARLGFLILADLSPGGAPLIVAGLHLDLNTARVALTAGAWLLAAGVMVYRSAAPAPMRAIVASYIGLFLLALAPAHAQSGTLSLCATWSLFALTICAADRAAGWRMRWTGAGVVVLGMSFIAWLLAWADHGFARHTAPIGAHPGLWSAVLIGAAAVAIARWLSPGDRAGPRPGVLLAGSFAAAIFFVASSFEVARGATEWTSDHLARQGALSIYWGVFAVVTLLVGFRRRIAVIRYAGLGLMAVAAVKTAVLDLASAPPEWRIASFTALGLLMVGVAAGYARITQRLERSAVDGTDAPPDVPAPARAPEL